MCTCATHNTRRTVSSEEKALFCFITAATKRGMWRTGHDKTLCESSMEFLERTNESRRKNASRSSQAVDCSPNLFFRIERMSLEILVTLVFLLLHGWQAFACLLAWERSHTTKTVCCEEEETCASPSKKGRTIGRHWLACLRKTRLTSRIIPFTRTDILSIQKMQTELAYPSGGRFERSFRSLWLWERWKSRDL